MAHHVRAFEFFDGVAEITVPDQTKTAVIRASRYDPELHRTYLEMARHYATVIVPARPRKPREKAKVEAAVLLGQRWLVAVLRKQVFFCVRQANEAVRELLPRLNTAAGSRSSTSAVESSTRRWTVPR